MAQGAKGRSRQADPSGPSTNQTRSGHVKGTGDRRASLPPYTGPQGGLRTIVVEQEAPGGQAETSSRIENYLGFPSGISGAELASRALRQAATHILSRPAFRACSPAGTFGLAR